MPTRRELLFSLATASLAATTRDSPEGAGPDLEMWQEPHCLSQESASGFRLLLNSGHMNNGHSVSNGTFGDRENRRVIIAPGARRISLAACKELWRRVQGGAWLIFEAGVCFSSVEEAKGQAAILNSVFDLKVLPALPASAGGLNDDSYVAYTWPLRGFTRTFEMITPICCELNESIAWFRGWTVCARRAVGKGGIVYLGSMLGPNLLAEEREAHAIGSAMICMPN